MSLESKIFKGVSWMAFFNFFSQCVSWTITVLIARILLPSDYGLMAMATIITGYALNLSDIGLGNAIIQRLQVFPKRVIFCFLVYNGYCISPCSQLFSNIVFDSLHNA